VKASETGIGKSEGRLEVPQKCLQTYRDHYRHRGWQFWCPPRRPDCPVWVARALQLRPCQRLSRGCPSLFPAGPMSAPLSHWCRAWNRKRAPSMITDRRETFLFLTLLWEATCPISGWEALWRLLEDVHSHYSRKPIVTNACGLGSQLSRIEGLDIDRIELRRFARLFPCS